MAEVEEDEFLHFLDWEIRSVILKPSNMLKLYNEKEPLITFLIYHDDDYIYRDAEAHIVYTLKAQLQHLGYCEADLTQLNRTSNSHKHKLALLKATINLVNEANDEDLNSEEITHLFLDDEWVEIIQHYKYYRAIELCENDDALHYEMLEVFIELDKERVNKVAKSIAINKIKRNKLFYCGLAQKLNMRDCGVPLAVS